MATKYHGHDRAPLEGRARLVFENLGYSVRYDGDALKAERDGKTVRVVTVDGDEPPSLERKDIDKYCLVADGDKAESLKQSADGTAPSGTDLAVIGLEGDDYFVA